MYLDQNLIRNAPVTSADARRAVQIYGPDIVVLKGKTTKPKAQEHVPMLHNRPVPPAIMDNHREIILCVDFFFVQGNPFLHTFSRKLGYRTAVPVPDKSKSTIIKEIKRVIQMYEARGFQVIEIYGDDDFSCTRNDVRPAHVKPSMGR